MKIRYLLLIIAFLTSCGIRKSKINKTLDVVQTEKTFKSDLESKTDVSTKNTESTKQENNKVSDDHETTTIKKYALDPAGKPFLREETTTTKKSSRTDKSTLSSEKKTASDSSTKVKVQIKTKDKGFTKKQTKDKGVEADKTVAANLGGWAVVILFGLAMFIYFIITKKK